MADKAAADDMELTNFVNGMLQQMQQRFQVGQRARRRHLTSPSLLHVLNCAACTEPACTRLHAPAAVSTFGLRAHACLERCICTACPKTGTQGPGCCWA